MATDIKILSIETSGTTCGVCLSVDGTVIADYSLYGSNLHDKLLTENIRRILKDNDREVSQLDAVAVSAGPGSFTGLRIGAAVAKGLCHGNQPKLIAAPTLAAIAASSVNLAKKFESSEITATIQSHKEIMYYQKFDLGLKALNEIQTVTHDEFNEAITSNTVICGTAAKFAKKGNIDSNNNEIRVRNISDLAFQMYKESHFTSSEEFTPLYVQDFVVKKKKKKNKLSS